MQHEAVCDFILQRLVQELQMFGPFGQHQDFAALPVRRQYVIGDFAIASRIAHQNTEDFLDGSVQGISGAGKARGNTISCVGAFSALVAL